MKTHAGSCHCGGVRFSLRWEPTELTTCDCSLCVKRNAMMTKVPEDALKLIKGEELLSLYEWNTRRAKHYFCRICGLYVFHRKRAAPDHFGVNIFCLDDFDPGDVRGGDTLQLRYGATRLVGDALAVDQHILRRLA